MRIDERWEDDEDPAGVPNALGGCIRRFGFGDPASDAAVVLMAGVGA